MKEFRFGDRVKIIGGFYDGCEGILTDCIIETYKDGGSINSRNIFEVEISKINAYYYCLSKTIDIDGSLLQLIRKAV